MSGDKLLGTAFSLEMKSSARGIYLRVTVPLTNLHRDLDFVGMFFFFMTHRAAFRRLVVASREFFIERARGNLSERSFLPLPPTLITSFRFKRASN